MTGYYASPLLSSISPHTITTDPHNYAYFLPFALFHNDFIPTMQLPLSLYMYDRSLVYLCAMHSIIICAFIEGYPMPATTLTSLIIRIIPKIIYAVNHVIPLDQTSSSKNTLY